MASIQLHKPKKRKLIFKREHGVTNIKVEDRDSCNIDDAEDDQNDGYNIDDAEDEQNEAEEVEGDDDDSGNQNDDVGDEVEDDGDDTGNNKQNNKTYHRRKVTHGFHLVQGKMDHGMEDYIVAKSREVNGNELGLYAIFDGHSGREAAKYLQKHLFGNILNQPDFWTSPKTAIKRAYRITDDDILENVVGSRGGSTAVTAILVNGRNLVVANVGDSRGVICKNGKAKQITVDHEPLREKNLVESRGGFVVKRPGNVPRVDGQLAMTRAFGDGKLKDHITAEPDITIEKIDNDTKFIILASDGLWKVMSNEEACDCIKEIDNAQEASKELIKEAILRDSRDDISCIVVMFQ